MKELKEAIAFCAVGVAALFVFCWFKTGVAPGKFLNALLSRPPVAITARKGVLSDYVIQVHNNSCERIRVHLEIYQWKIFRNSDFIDNSGIYAIDPGKTKDFGVMEFRHGWKPKFGDEGIVHVEGFLRKATFLLLPGYTSDNDILSGFSYGNPNDYPSHTRKDR